MRVLHLLTFGIGMSSHVDDGVLQVIAPQFKSGRRPHFQEGLFANEEVGSI